MKLHLVSASHNCTIFFVVRSLLSECTNGRTTKLLNWPIELFRQYDTTEIWIQLAVSDGVSKAESNSDDASLAGSYMNNVTLAGSLYDLFLVGKLGKLQGRLVIPGSGLTPPVRMHWVTVEEAKHYFNCVTGEASGGTYEQGMSGITADYISDPQEHARSSGRLFKNNFGTFAFIQLP